MKTIDNDDIQEKLDFLNLNLEKIPKFIKNGSIPSISTTRISNNSIKTYKYVPINNIEILFTPHLRSDDFKKKYTNSVPLNKCLNPDGNEEEKILYKLFLKILRNTKIEEVEKIENQQNRYLENRPFKIKYRKDHVWEIYYSQKSDKYFMFVCTKENSFNEFVYLLKKQIELAKSKEKISPLIYVPINGIEYSAKLMKKSEITDLENYLWLFTRNWPLFFESYDIDERLSLYIVGETYVYDNVKSNYRIKIDNKDDAIKFYKLLKALFIIQTEIHNQYKFETKIDDDSELHMYLSKVEITYDSLTDFVKNEFALADYEIINKNKEIIKKEKKLSELKTSVKEKENEYVQKQKEITMYLECKKTFIGKVKYFFKLDKKLIKQSQNIEDILESEDLGISTKPIKTSIGKKVYYTIEDLVVIYNTYDKCTKKIKEIEQDIDAMKLKLENLISKVKNANQYIEEIDKHKKSIFDFWKFANKDEKLSLEQGNEKNKEGVKTELKKSFDIISDFERMGEAVDKIQRKKLSNEELDSIYISNTEILSLINMIDCNKISKSKFMTSLKELREEFDKEKIVLSNETFDIFGNIDENTNKVKYIGSKSHRENEKNKFKIMNINKKIDIFDYTEKLQSILNFIGSSMTKMTSVYDMKLYKIKDISETLSNDRYEIFDINVEKELKKCKKLEDLSCNLICLNFKEKMPLVYYSNSVFYDNYNKTLPFGMNLSSNILIDNKKFEFELVNQSIFKTNLYFSGDNEEDDYSVREIHLYEYDVSLKSKRAEENVVEKSVKNKSSKDLSKNLAKNKKKSKKEI